jgi:hypothetical protein
MEYETLQKFFHCAVKAAVGPTGRMCGEIAHKPFPALTNC